MAKHKSGELRCPATALISHAKVHLVLHSSSLTKLVFHHCPSLTGHAQEVDKILGNWKSYKMSVPTYGAIMLDPDMKYVSTGFYSCFCGEFNLVIWGVW